MILLWVLQVAPEVSARHELCDQHGAAFLNTHAQQSHNVLSTKPLQHCHLHSAGPSLQKLVNSPLIIFHGGPCMLLCALL